MSSSTTNLFGLPVRLPFAAGFGVLLLAFGWLGFVPSSNPTPIDDKALHFIAFFILTLVGYWTVDLNRRLLIKIVPVAALALDVGSEFAQSIINREREFDVVDIAANVLGSFTAIALCAWYHRRMLERKRKRKLQGYGLVTTDDVVDIELGEGSSGQETGIIGEEEEEEDGEAWDDMNGNETPETPETSNGTSEGYDKKASNE